MRLLIYIEPTSYLTPLWQAIKARSTAPTRLIFLEENLSQAWNIDLGGDPDVQLLRGGSWAKLRQLIHLITQCDVELVALDGWGHPLMVAAMLLAWTRGIPTTVGSDTQHEPTKALWRRALKRVVLPVLFRVPKFVFPGGTRQAAYFSRYGVPNERIRIRQMSVDVRSIMTGVERYRAALPPDIGDDKPTTFLYVGRLEPYKGVEDLLAAFTLLLETHPDTRLVIVGDGSMRALVESEAKSYPAIEYLGRLSGDALTDAYGDADVFVLPSHFEPWGLVVNEAMAACLPVIATDRVGCVDDLVHDGVNGRVVPAYSAGHLADAMRTFVGQREMIAGMGRKSRQMIGNWSIEDEARIMMTAWDALA